MIRFTACSCPPTVEISCIRFSGLNRSVAVIPSACMAFTISSSDTSSSSAIRVISFLPSSAMASCSSSPASLPFVSFVAALLSVSIRSLSVPTLSLVTSFEATVGSFFCTDTLTSVLSFDAVTSFAVFTELSCVTASFARFRITSKLVEAFALYPSDIVTTETLEAAVPLAIIFMAALIGFAALLIASSLCV